MSTLKMAGRPGVPLFAVVLCGGWGRRMAADRPKPLLLLDSRPILSHVIDRIEPFVDGLVVSANDAEAFSRLPYTIIADDTPDRPGAVAGLVAAAGHFDRATGGAFRLLAVPGDTPFLPHDLVERLVGAGDEGSVAASNGQLHPTVAIWPSEILQSLTIDPQSPRRSRSLRAIQERHRFHPVDFATSPDAPGGDPFFNVNTPDDLGAARRALADRG